MLFSTSKAAPENTVRSKPWAPIAWAFCISTTPLRIVNRPVTAPAALLAGAPLARPLLSPARVNRPRRSLRTEAVGGKFEVIGRPPFGSGGFTTPGRVGPPGGAYLIAGQ